MLQTVFLVILDHSELTPVATTSFTTFSVIITAQMPKLTDETGVPPALLNLLQIDVDVIAGNEGPEAVRRMDFPLELAVHQSFKLFLVLSLDLDAIFLDDHAHVFPL